MGRRLPVVALAKTGPINNLADAMSGRPIHMKKTKKRFSLRRHIKSLEAAVMRFPLASACAVAITAVGITLIHIDGSEDPYIKLLLVLFLALPVFVCLQLVRERAREIGRAHV